MTDITKQDVGVDALGYVVEFADVGRIYAEKIAETARGNRVEIAVSSPRNLGFG